MKRGFDINTLDGVREILEDSGMFEDIEIDGDAILLPVNYVLTMEDGKLIISYPSPVELAKMFPDLTVELDESEYE